MKVLFLDVDGVLNKQDDYKVLRNGDGHLYLNWDMLETLQKIVEDTGCKVVLSSVWRILKENQDFIKEHVEIFGMTDKITDAYRRGGQIQRWLNVHPDVEVYAIVDDDSDMLDSQLPHFFQTELAHGLTPGIAYRITYHLNNGGQLNG
jgi:hypothetical protein